LAARPLNEFYFSAPAWAFIGWGLGAPMAAHLLAQGFPLSVSQPDNASR